MGKKVRKTNPGLLSLVDRLKRQSFEKKAPVWRDIADRLMKPKSQWAEVNLSRIERYAADDETIIVPGKVLGAGALNKKVNVAAFRCSEAARKKIAKAGGKSISIDELMEMNPEGSNIRIMR